MFDSLFGRIKKSARSMAASTGHDDDAGGLNARSNHESDAEFLNRVAHEELPSEIAERWLALARPAARLTEAGPGEPVVARLGGAPVVPASFEWPTWDGHGPLSFVAEVDLEALASTGVNTGLTLPGNGRLLAFYFDGSYDDFDGIVGTWDADSMAGQRLLHLPARTIDCSPMDTPDVRVLAWPEKTLTAKATVTVPGWEHPVLAREFLPQSDPYSPESRKHPLLADRFNDSVWEGLTTDSPTGGGPLHQLGGWANPIQGPVELEVLSLDQGTTDLSAEELAVRADQWLPLLTIDSDEAVGMMWGDVGALYWLVHRNDIAGGRLGTPRFTWQCS